MHRLSIYRGIDIEHRNISKEFWIVFKCVFIVSLDKLLSNLFLNHLLSFLIVRICISESYLSFLFCFLLVHDFLEAVSDDFLKFAVIVRSKSLSQGRVRALQPCLEVLVCEPHLLDFADFLSDAHSLRIVDHLVGQLLLSESRTLTGTATLGKEVVHQVLILRVKLGDSHVDHVSMINSDSIELGRVVHEHELAEV